MDRPARLVGVNSENNMQCQVQTKMGIFANERLKEALFNRREVAFL